MALALLALNAAQSAEYHRFTNPPDWIDTLQPDYAAAAPPSGATNGAWVILLDRQINVVERGDDHYQHLAVKVLNSVGVGEYSQIDFAVDPTFQTLEIHRLQVVRDGVTIDQRPLARVTELSEETDLSRKIYNGRYNVNVLLSDVRAGDVVEYSYTLHSRDRIFAGHYAARFDTGWGIPVHRQHMRVLTPLERPARYRSSESAALPEPRVRDGRRELVLEWRDQPAFTAGHSLPGWYTPWPYVEISDLENWAAVSKLVDPLFRPPRDAGPRVQAAIEEIRRAGGAPEERALRALRFVQEQVRYTSIAIGRGSHEPNPPDIVLERMFGDCKDKSLLLTTMLHGLGIEASVALVHSWRGRALDSALPTPYAFDHAIVRAEIGDSIYWLDPTSTAQYEPLATASPATAFERALVTAAASPVLSAIPQPPSDARAKDVSVFLDLTDGFDGPGTLEITTRFTGALADSTRESLTRGNSEQRQLDYETYTARYYPGARILGPIDVRDDREHNVIDVRERYRLDGAFVPNAAGLLELSLHADEIYSYAEPLGAGGRDAPLALEYPIRVRQSIRALLPEEWYIEPHTVAVDNPAFRYRAGVEYAAKTLLLTYEYEALADYVAAPAIPRLEADRAKMYENLGYQLTYNRGLASGDLAVAPVPMLVALLSLAISIWWAVRYGYRYDPQPHQAAATAPVGIRGWLLIPALSVIVMAGVCAFVLVAWLPTIEANAWRGLPLIVEDAYASWIQPAVVVVVAGSTVLAVASVLSAVLFFAKRTSGPAVFVAVAWAGVAFWTAVTAWSLLSGLDTETRADAFGREATRDVIGTLIWTAYMLSSKRVAATFTRRYRGTATEARPAVAAGAS